ncbi:hypothetical protein [Lacticaseibacillus songhuajiangensis]|uniref:hypothetical protein n=1 Tax=Lacticaseibacillus songhuajiangensis TaxID=1296539 RepID=UPI000F7B30DC|nr:hypothetical protein [Lacticaseibacillus songhuajiangensis]
MATLFQGLIIAMLVVIGLIFILSLPAVMKSRSLQKMVANPKQWTKRLHQVACIFLGLLGLAFYLGALQALIIGVMSQLIALGLIGTICIVVGVWRYIIVARSNR